MTRPAIKYLLKHTERVTTPLTVTRMTINIELVSRPAGAVVRPLDVCTHLFTASVVLGALIPVWSRKIISAIMYV